MVSLLLISEGKVNIQIQMGPVASTVKNTDSLKRISLWRRKNQCSNCGERQCDCPSSEVLGSPQTESSATLVFFLDMLHQSHQIHPICKLSEGKRLEKLCNELCVKAVDMLLIHLFALDS